MRAWPARPETFPKMMIDVTRARIAEIDREKEREGAGTARSAVDGSVEWYTCGWKAPRRSRRACYKGGGPEAF